jgi:hypothetical protein
MALFNTQDLKVIGLQVVQRSNYKTSESALEKNFKEFSQTKNYDVFLSHSFRDAQVILGLKTEIESLGYSIYIDWVEDSQLDRSRVTKETAQILKQRMGKCKCLFFATSINSPTSSWMPWELGYFDGCNGKVAILPITSVPTKGDSYKGQEYLGLYYYVTKTLDNTKKPKLWINQEANNYVLFNDWLTGTSPSLHN